MATSQIFSTASLQLGLDKTSTPQNSSIWHRYTTYVSSQEALKVYWFLKAVIIIPCVYMVLSIIAMAQLTPYFLFFVALSMVLFFANVIVHIVECKSSVFVPLYHLTGIILFGIPFILYLSQ